MKRRHPDSVEGQLGSRNGKAPRVKSGRIRTTELPSGEAVPVLGLGTWRLAEGLRPRAEEAAALRLGLDLGMTLIDTAEMYGDGAAEELVGEVIAGRREGLFLVSKVLPMHARRLGTITACEGSLRRLGTDRLDLYLLHWRGEAPLEETLEAFSILVRAGKIRYWGVSNFDLSDMEELVALPGGPSVATDQVLYNLTRRGIEYNLLPWCRERKIPIMAYSPIEQGRLLNKTALKNVAARHGATAAQVALAWVLRQEKLIAIPKAATPAHVEENRGALNVHLTGEDLAELDRAFPPPDRPVPLEMI
jgi:diketogulonate reductase-like aldo/keto reductase